MFYRLDWKGQGTDEKLANTKNCVDVDVPWRMGILLPDSLGKPIECWLHEKRGDVLRDIFLVDIPLFSKKLIDILESEGVDNLQKYPAVLHGKNGELFENYFAVNIVGTVLCADLGKSTYLPDSDPPLMEFSNLVIDSSLVHSQQLFRLGENTLYIIVNQKLGDRLSGESLVGVFLNQIES
ncbi:MAG: hypothetical protein OEZ43_14340 [Gammaproteobacteria bacterium]|nr:hypothetical protein [Gammaproteobacteria bacterium]